MTTTGENSNRLQDKVVFVTGAAAGIGRACALEYARQGAHVIVADLNISAANEVIEQCATDGLAIPCDVANAHSVEAAMKETAGHFGHIDAIHNNAGVVGPARPLHESDESEWEEVLRVNLKSVYLTTRFGFAAVKASRGSILNTASIVGVIGQDNHAAYVASKGGMIALTKAMALDYAPMGVRVNAICPAAVWTPMLRTWAASLPNPSEIECLLDRLHPLGFCPEAKVIADAATFLISDQASFITGCILPVTGGAELGYRRQAGGATESQ